MDAADGADRLATEATQLAQTGVCAPGDAPAGQTVRPSFRSAGDAHAPGGDRVEPRRHAEPPERPRLLRELEALDRGTAEMGCSRSQAVRLLVHCLANGGTSLGADTITFDYETSHGIVRSLRSIRTLYNQSVAALNTIAKVARES
jgi:hypothetical protein